MEPPATGHLHSQVADVTTVILVAWWEPLGESTPEKPTVNISEKPESWRQGNQCVPGSGNVHRITQQRPQMDMCAHSQLDRASP